MTRTAGVRVMSSAPSYCFSTLISAHELKRAGLPYSLHARAFLLPPDYLTTTYPANILHRIRNK